MTDLRDKLASVTAAVALANETIDVRLAHDGCRLAVAVAQNGMGSVDMLDEPRRASTQGRLERSKGKTSLAVRELAPGRANAEVHAPFVYATGEA